MDLTNDVLFNVLREVKPLRLEGSEALQQASRSPGTFFPTLRGIDKSKILRMAIEVKDYTERCWQGTKRLNDLSPIPAKIYIAEFGI
jgi:hypothetical protein